MPTPSPIIAANWGLSAGNLARLAASPIAAKPARGRRPDAVWRLEDEIGGGARAGGKALCEKVARVLRLGARDAELGDEGAAEQEVGARESGKYEYPRTEDAPARAVGGACPAFEERGASLGDSGVRHRCSRLCGHRRRGDRSL